MWKKEMNTARSAAMEAGKILKELYGNIRNISKKGKIDLVTEADLASEKAVIDIITRDFPDDMIIAEESGETGEISDRQWIVDPLDGTTNFAHSFPFFGVSIAFQAEDELVAGVVYNPVLDEFFEAEKGKGAFLNNEPIKVSDRVNLKDSLLGTGFPYDVYEDPDPVMDILKRMIIKVQGIRRAGAAAVDLCYLAAGRLDGFWEQDLKPWDTAAGTVILKEAGGVISDFQGNLYNPYMKSVLASTPGIYGKMLEVLNSSNL
ncbi:MAG: inositol monophosphatase family protein [Thermodesulfobacteriota bacterium]|nr:inositol monophosphatase family protein [Thermodesulfobacteriota bacterium]